MAANSAELFLTPSEWDCWWAEGGDVARAGLGWAGLGWAGDTNQIDTGGAGLGLERGQVTADQHQLTVTQTIS